jgi:hypothetical protein
MRRFGMDFFFFFFFFFLVAENGWDFFFFGLRKQEIEGLVRALRL